MILIEKYIEQYDRYFASYFLIELIYAINSRIITIDHLRMCSKIIA